MNESQKREAHMPLLWVLDAKRESV